MKSLRKNTDCKDFNSFRMYAVNHSQKKNTGLSRPQLPLCRNKKKKKKRNYLFLCNILGLTILACSRVSCHPEYFLLSRENFRLITWFLRALTLSSMYVCIDHLVISDFLQSCPATQFASHLLMNVLGMSQLSNQ